MTYVEEVAASQPQNPRTGTYSPEFEHGYPKTPHLKGVECSIPAFLVSILKVQVCVYMRKFGFVSTEKKPKVPRDA